MRVLCVAEKPSIAKSITEILSGGDWESRNGCHKYCRNFDFPYRLPPPLGGNGDAFFTVTSVLGHLTATDFDEDHRKWHSCDPFSLFDAPIITSVNQDHKSVERNLQQEARRANLLIIWTDCDREGEHIGYEIVAACRKANANLRVKRARFSAIIAAQIHEACRSANDLDMRMVDAVSTRIDLDLRIGVAFTRFMTLTLQNRLPELAEKIISYGPCQFPTLGFVVDQYNRVQSFVPEPFWYIAITSTRPAEDENEEDTEVGFTWRRGHLFDLDIAMLLYQECSDNPLATVMKVETKPTSKWKPLPLTTVELQQSGSRLLGMTPKRVLDLAEKLYQKGFLSYPRTETDQYDKAFDFKALIQKQTPDPTWGGYAQQLLDGAFQRPRNGRKNDKAHPPIHPTHSATNLEADEKRVYELVTRRFLASCSSNAEGKQTTVEIEIAGEYFSTSGVVILHRNYLEVYPYDKWSSNPLPDFQEGEQFLPSSCELKEGSTSRPNLLTEADLVGLMDRNGIGTDATIAEHIAKIIEREYVIAKTEQKTKYLVPSQLGIGLVEGYNAIGFDRSLSKPHLRRETEHRMQLICDGQQTKREVLEATVAEFKEVYVKARLEFNTVVNAVTNYLHGEGEAQEALRAAARGRGRGRGAAPARGARGGRGGGGGAAGNRRPRDDDDDEDDDDDGDDDDGPAGGGGAGRARGTARARGSTSTRGTSTRGRGASNTTTNPRPAKRQRTDAGDDEVNCGCEVAAVLRTAGPSSANAGRQFYTCAKAQGEQCGFFAWADDNAPQRESAPPVAQSRAPRTSGGRTGTVRCECGLEAVSMTVNKEGPNKGRTFWKCPNAPRAQCKFFEWDDEAPRTSGSGSSGFGAGSSGGGGASGECYKCGETGHWSNSCPNGDRPAANGHTRGSGSRSGFAGGGSGGGSSGECYKCGEAGHWSNACPNGDRSSTNGHAGGSFSRSGFAAGSGGGSSGECFKCGESGHWASACPNPDGGGSRGGPRSTRGSRGGKSKRGGRGGSRGGGSGGGSTGECYKCGEGGHWANACPN